MAQSFSRCIWPRIKSRKEERCFSVLSDVSTRAVYTKFGSADVLPLYDLFAQSLTLIRMGHTYCELTSQCSHEGNKGVLIKELASEEGPLGMST